MDTIRARQIDALVQMLNLHGEKKIKKIAEENGTEKNRRTRFYDENSVEDDGDEVVWKVLVIDEFSRDVISTVLKVSDLRENGITVHMMLDSVRSSISDVPAIYFMRATYSNMTRLAQDMGKEMYDLYYVNLCDSITRDLMEELAVATVASKTSHQIAQVFDKYIEFICPEENMVSFGIKDSFKKTHDPTLTEEKVKELVDQIVGQMISVLVTLKTVPIICAPKGGAAEMVANKLNYRIRESVSHSKYHLFSDSEGEGWCGGITSEPGSRAVLVLLDRDFDIGSMLSHSWTYQALIHDILGIELNRITLNTEVDGKKTKKVYDLDAKDEFWARIASMPFPEAAISIDETSTDFKKQADEMTRMGVSTDNLGLEQELDFGNSTRQLQKAVDSLPEMTARKAAIDMHMNVATALLEKIKERQLDIIFQLEENMNKQTRQTILDFLNDEGRGSLNDKLRVLMLYLLSRQGKGGNVGGMAGSSSGLDGLQASGKSQSMDSVAEAFEKAFLEKDVDLSALAYFKKLQAMNKIMLQNVVTSSPSVGGSDFLGKFSSIGSKLSAIKDGTGLASGLFAGVKGFLPQDKDLPITQLVKSIMERPGNIGTASASSSPMLGGGGIGGVGDNMIYLDPLSTSPPSFSLFPPADQGKFGHQQKSVISSFQNCIVFVIGGGNYLEYQNLQDYANESSPRKFIIYGSTDIVNPEGLLKQFSELNSLQS